MVDWLARRFGIDAAQADRVSRTAVEFLDQIHAPQDLDNAQRQQRKLQWAARLHEIGMHISHSDYHKHGAYILENTDMPGFTVDELHRLGQLVLGHRGKLRKLDLALDDPLFVCQLLALRLGVILCHARREPQTEDITLEHDARNQTFQLTLPEGWDKLYPQSAHLLREEVTAWQKTSWRFVLHISRQDHAIHIGM